MAERLECILQGTKGDRREVLGQLLDSDVKRSPYLLELKESTRVLPQLPTVPQSKAPSTFGRSEQQASVPGYSIPHSRHKAWLVRFLQRCSFIMEPTPEPLGRGSRDIKLRATSARMLQKGIFDSANSIRTKKAQLTVQGPFLPPNASGLAGPQTHTAHMLTHMIDSRNKH